MPSLDQAFEENRVSWDKRVAPHLSSEMYDLPGFRRGKSSLKAIELEWMGDVTDQSLLHLQCHFGQDTLSWGRLGATVTGVDFSPKAIETARRLSDEIQVPAEFICCNVLDTNQHLIQQFDRVFTSYGTITWLPDLEPWASVVAERLKPGGFFLMVDFHPVLWMLDDNYQTLHYPYWSANHQVFELDGTYADEAADIQTRNHWWNHPLTETMGALLKVGLVLERASEFDFSAYNCLPGMEAIGDDRFILPNFGQRIPYMYALKFSKPNLA